MIVIFLRELQKELNESLFDTSAVSALTYDLASGDMQLCTNCLRSSALSSTQEFLPSSSSIHICPRASFPLHAQKIPVFACCVHLVPNDQGSCFVFPLQWEA